MRKLLVCLVVLLAATLSFSGAPPDRLPTLTAPAEARMVMVITGQPPPAGGGVLGVESITEDYEPSIAANTAIAYVSGYVAPVSGNLGTGYVKIKRRWSATNLKIVVWDSSHAVVGATGAIALGDGNPLGIVSGAFASGSVTQGQTYHIGFITDGADLEYFSETGTGWNCHETANSYTTPTTLAVNNQKYIDEFLIYATIE